MHITTMLQFLALGSSALLANANALPTEPEPGSDAGSDTPWTSVQCAAVTDGSRWNDTSVQYMDCDALAREQEDRAAHCEPGGCPLPCNIRVTRKVTLNGKGTWWTRWCHAGGLHTANVGSMAFVSTGHSTTVSWSGDVSIAGEVGKWIGASFGFEISKTKSISQGVGCTNSDGRPHAVWLQERMGWMDTTVVTTTTETGGSCNEPGTHTFTQHVHVDYPDPNQTGYRDFIAGCGSPDDDSGPWCNLDAKSLQG